jgi:hypothetical protein
MTVATANPRFGLAATSWSGGGATDYFVQNNQAENNQPNATDSFVESGL